MQGEGDQDPIALANRLAADLDGPAPTPATAPAATPAAPPEKLKPAFVIAGAIARASIGGIVAWCLDKGSAYMLVRFGVKPGPASIPITWEMAEAFGITEAERETMGITRETPFEFPYTGVAAEATALTIQRWGWEGDLRIHPLLVLGAVVIATPITMYMRSPGLIEQPKHEGRKARKPTPIREAEESDDDDDKERDDR